jgi:hypothetical protein
MKNNLFKEVLILLLIFVVGVSILFLIPQPTHQVINCSLAEISPDFTPEMRKECRIIRGTKL